MTGSNGGNDKLVIAKEKSEEESEKEDETINEILCFTEEDKEKFQQEIEELHE